MIPHLVCFLCFNRLGLTVKNLNAILNTNEDFELYIVDNNSSDGTFEYLQTLRDPRIKEVKHFDANRWVVYPFNYVLSHRKPGQSFLYIENDVHIHTPDFITKFNNVINEFPHVGMLGALYDGWIDFAIQIGAISWSELITHNSISYYKVPLMAGCCVFLKSEVLDIIGYANEETYGADVGECYRINNFTPYHTGLVNPKDIKVTIQQSVYCNDCLLKNSCKFYQSENTFPKCMTSYIPCHNRVSKFNKMQAEKGLVYMNELTTGKRTVYCASTHDPESRKNHYYNKEWAEENFNFFINEVDFDKH